MGKKRISYLDMVKGIGIILVVFGHSTCAPAEVLTWIVSFHMPLFFIVSGMLIYHVREEDRNMKVCVRKKLKTLMLPYITFSIIYILIKIFFLFVIPSWMTKDQLLQAIYQTVTLYGISVMWFLPALFLGQIVFLGVRKLRKYREGATITVAIGLAIVPIYLKPVVEKIEILGLRYFAYVLLRASIAFAFITLGYYAKKYFIKEREKKSIWEFVLGVVLLILLVCMRDVNTRVDMNFVVFGKYPLVFYVNAVIGSMSIVLICKNMKTIRTLVYLGANSLVIMATHIECQVLRLSILFASTISRYSPCAKGYVFYLSMILGVVVMEVISIYIFNNYLYFLIGKKKGRNK